MLSQKSGGDSDTYRERINRNCFCFSCRSLWSRYLRNAGLDKCSSGAVSRHRLQKQLLRSVQTSGALQGVQSRGPILIKGGILVC